VLLDGPPHRRPLGGAVRSSKGRLGACAAVAGRSEHGRCTLRLYVLPLKRRLTLDVGRGLPGSAGRRLKQGGRVVKHTSKLLNAIAVAKEGRGGDVRFLGEIDTTEVATRKLVAKLATKYIRLTFCYEAGQRDTGSIG
jgi:hypothetical protein